MPLGRLRTGPREQPVPLPAAGSSKICQLPASTFPQRWDQASHEVDADAMDVDDETCSHPPGTSELLAYAQSLTLSHSLASTRQRHMTSILPRVFTHSRVSKIRTRPFAAVEYFPSTSFHSVNAEPVKGKGKQKAVNQDLVPTPLATLTDGPPAHELSCIGWCGLQVGPVEPEGVSIWLGKFVRDRPGDSVNLDAQRRERERKERERRERERQLQAQAAAKRQQSNAQSLKPADIPLTLIQKVNQAASQNPWLATLIHKAAKHEASKDELTQLGKVVSTLQAQLATEAAKAKAGTPTPTPPASSTTQKPVASSPAVSSSSKPVAAKSSAPSTAGSTTPAPVVRGSATTAPPVAVKAGTTQPFAPPFAARQTTTSVPNSQQAPKPAILHAPQYAPPRPQVQSLPELPSIPFIVISFRDNPSDKFLLPLGTQSFMSRVPPRSATTTQSMKKERQKAQSFPTLDPEDQEISVELDNVWEHPPASGTVLISYMVPCAGWKTPEWPAKPRPGTSQVARPSSTTQHAQAVITSPVVKPAPAAQLQQRPAATPATPATSATPTIPATPATPSATQTAGTASEPAPVSQPATTSNIEVSSVSAVPSIATPLSSTTPTPAPAPAPAPAPTLVSPIATAASQPTPAPEAKASVPAPPVALSASAAMASRPTAPVYPPLIRLSTTSLVPDEGAVRPITIRLTGVTDVTWRAMQDIIKVVEFDEMGDLALYDPPAAPPTAQAAPISAVTNAGALTATEKLTRAAEEERRKEEEKRLAKLREEYEAKEEARKAKIASRHEKKADTFRKLMGRVPARSFLKHRLEKVPSELVEAETDKFGPRLYNIYPRSRFGLPPPAYKSTMDDTAQIELDLEEPSAAAAAPNPRKRKSEPAVAFEVPMSFDGIDEAVEQQARKALLKGQAGSKRRKSEGGEETKRKVGKRSLAGSICEGCGSAKFRVWRKGPGGKATLCKICGDKFNAGTLGPLVAPGAAKLKTEPTSTESGKAPSALGPAASTVTAGSSTLLRLQPSSAVQSGVNQAAPATTPVGPPQATQLSPSQPAVAATTPTAGDKSATNGVTSDATTPAVPASSLQTATTTSQLPTAAARPPLRTQIQPVSTGQPISDTMASEDRKAQSTEPAAEAAP